MKKTGFFTLFFIFLCASVWGREYTWTGEVSGNWNDAGNWTCDDSDYDGLYYPGENPDDIAIIDDSTLVQNVQITAILTNSLESLTIDNVSLNLDSFAFDVGTLIIINNNADISNTSSLTVSTLLRIDDATIDFTASSLAVDTLILINGAELTGDLTADNVTIDNFSKLVGTISFSGGGTLEINTLNTEAAIKGNNIVCGNLNLGTRDVYIEHIGSGGSVELNSGIFSGDIYLTVNGTGLVYIDTNWSFQEVTLNTDVTLNSDLSTDTLSPISNDLNVGNNTLSVTGVFTQSAGTIELSGGTVKAGSITTDGTINITTDGTLKSNSDITQNAEKVTGEKLILDAAGAITLTGNNEAAVLEITGAGGAVRFTNSVGLEVAGITAGDNVTITTNGNLIVSGNIEADGTVTITTDGELTISGNIEADAAVTITVTTGGLIVNDIITAGGDITLNIEGVISGNSSGKLDGKDIKVNADGNITLPNISGASIVLNAGGDITLPYINGASVSLNAGYPKQMVFGMPGTVTLTNLTLTSNLTIWCKSVISSTGTKNVTGNVELNTDDTNAAGNFLTNFTISGTTDNKLRSGAAGMDYEFGPVNTKGYHWINSNDTNLVWPLTLPTPSDGYDIYITGSITALGDLTINNTSGDIVFEGDFNADIYQLNIHSTGGKIIQSGGTITVNRKITVNVRGEISQDDGKITAGELNITAANEALILAKDNAVQKLTILSGGGDIEFKNDIDLEISGITGANDVVITVNGDIDLSGDIDASSITVEANTVTGNGIVTASTGDISLLLDDSNNISLNRFDASGGTITVSTKNQDIVYYSSATPSLPPSGGTWITPLFVEANSTYAGNVKLQTKGTSNNIYLVDVVDSSNKTVTADGSAGTAPNGFIEFYTTGTNSYTYSGANLNHLGLLPGEGGIRIVSAIVDIAGDLIADNIKLTLDGSGTSYIKAADITLGEIFALNDEDKITLEAEENITVSDINITNTVTLEAGSNITAGVINTANTVTLEAGSNIIAGVINTTDMVTLEAKDNITVSDIKTTNTVTLKVGGNITVNGIINTTNTVTLEADGNITVSGKTTAFQLIVKAPNGTVSIDAVEINSSNTGNELVNAAIYIIADNFAVTTTTANSIIPGGTGGHLCLTVNTQWTDINGVVDGIEGVPGTLGARWHQHISGVVIKAEILYSFTEDSNGNGRLDRIRVQSNYAINGDFSDFDITVEGYVIDRTKGNNGFQMVSAVTGKAPFDFDSFYIYLKENPEIDGGNTPMWSVTRNTSLLSATGSKLGDPAVDKDIKPIDTIPPRIAYTLTLPGNPQTYVQMSEPAVSNSGTVSASFNGTSNVNAQSAGTENLGYLFNHSKTYGVDDLAPLPDIYQDTTTTVVNGYFKIDNIVDKEPKPNWSVIDPACPPKYPLNWGYTEYAKVINDSSNAQSADGTVAFSDVFTPPNKLLTVDMMTKLAKGDGSLVTPNSSNAVIRRVTDVMISMAPSTANSSNLSGDDYFVWPVWAKPLTINAGTIWQFDGTAYLEKNLIEENYGIELQARIKNNLTKNLEFYWTMADIPAEMRNPKEATEAKKVGGLWLPNVSGVGGGPRLYNYVLLSDGINKDSALSSSTLFNFDITDDTLVSGGTKFEFIFRFKDSDMFAARLDAPPGIIPSNWYALIRPFSFDIQSIRQQRGGVTVMNNVINSDKKETAFIRYDLPRSGRVTIQIYTLDGTLIKSIRRNEYREEGIYVDTWDGSNNGGRAVARGMYFVRVVGPDIDEIRKIMVVK